MRYHVRARRFLNRLGHESGAYIIATVPDRATCATSCKHQVWDECWYSQVTIADCNRQITLEFNLQTPSRRSNSLHKIRTLIDVLEQVRAALEFEAERATQSARR